MILAGEHPDNQPTLLDREIATLAMRLYRSGWEAGGALGDARRACGATYNPYRQRHEYVGYTDAPREAI